MTTEQKHPVLCVPRRLLSQIDFKYGYAPVTAGLVSLMYTEATFLSRDWAEVPDDHGFLQVIPYTVFVERCPRTDAIRVLTYTRVKGSGESRLLGRKSIGFGGHIESTDMYPHVPDLLTSYAEAVEATVELAHMREIREELGQHIATTVHGKLALRGLIHSRVTPVGRVHLGLLHTEPIVMTPEVEASLTETTGHTKPELLPLDHVLENADDYEEWSVIAARVVARRGSTP